MGQPIEFPHVIQVALTQICLISAIGVILNVLTNRPARIVDRALAAALLAFLIEVRIATTNLSIGTDAAAHRTE